MLVSGQIYHSTMDGQLVVFSVNDYFDNRYRLDFIEFCPETGRECRKIGRWYNTYSFIQDAFIQEYDTSFLIDLALKTQDKDWFSKLLNNQKEELA
ncbi:hypothetical protein J7E55_12115 [Bacillus sp. ISL-53]|nr:hypothetical protein [Bacillus sp. ISL-53]